MPVGRFYEQGLSSGSSEGEQDNTQGNKALS